MASTSVTGTSGVRPLVVSTPATSAPASAPATAQRPGRNEKGEPLADKDVWGGIKTPEGLGVDTSDGISVGEGQALAQLAIDSAVEFVQRLDADSANGTPVKYHYEEAFQEIGTAFVDFEARSGNLLIESGVQVSQESVAKYLKEYLAPGEKQPQQPVVGKLTMTGKIAENGEIGALKGKLSLANLPRFSADKLAEFTKNIDAILAQLPVGGMITEEMRGQIAEQLKSKLETTSEHGVKFFKGLAEESRVFNFDVSTDRSATKAHIKAGLSALAVQVEHLVDEAGEGYPRIDGSTDITLDKADRDTIDLGTLSAYTTENLLVNVEDNKPKLFRIEADGTRTELKDIFGYLVYIPFLLAQLRGGRGGMF